LGVGTSAAAFAIHRTSDAPVCPRHLYAQHHAFVIGPRGLRNGTRLPPAWLRARALRWLFDHGNACQLSFLCSVVLL
jgi:hypothetical protein